MDWLRGRNINWLRSRNVNWLRSGHVDYLGRSNVSTCKVSSFLNELFYYKRSNS
jgi:hypothetical protein